MRRFATQKRDFSRCPWAEAAAQAVAEGRLTRQEIDESVGVGRSTLYRWVLMPAFKARVKAIVDDYREEIRRETRAKWRAEDRADRTTGHLKKARRRSG